MLEGDQVSYREPRPFDALLFVYAWGQVGRYLLYLFVYCAVVGDDREFL